MASEINGPRQASVERAMAATAQQIRAHLEGHFCGPAGKQPDPAAREVERDDPIANTELVKKAAKRFGADLAGVCRLNAAWFFPRNDGGRPVPQECDRVIVMAVAMDADDIRRSPAPEGGTATRLGYMRMAICASALGLFIRRLGYRAVAVGNGIALSVPLAVDAGLGEAGRSGMLITPELGPCLRLCKVFTDLPLEPGQPVEFGVQQRCDECRECARKCPAGAIDDAQAPAGRGAPSWPVDREKCCSFWQQSGSSCSTCVAVCPFMPA